MYRYIVSSLIKSTTRSKRTSKKKPVRKIIGDANTPLSQVWSNFINHEDNKTDLAKFLSERLIEHRSFLPPNCEVVTGGGFLDETVAKSFTSIEAIPQLAGNPEEADTHLILHAQDAVERSQYKKLIFICRDTDVLLLLMYIFGKQDLEVWMVSGTKKKMKCYPIHTMTKNLPEELLSNIIGFHALTGCDTVSSFSGLGKKTCWKVFGKYPNLLNGVGRDGGLEDEEKFVCRLYKSEVVDSGVNKARACIFDQGKVALEMLPSAQDALELHLSSANYQANAVAPSWLRWKWMWILLQVCWGGKDPQKAFKLCGIDLKVSPLSVLNW